MNAPDARSEALPDRPGEGFTKAVGDATPSALEDLRRPGRVAHLGDARLSALRESAVTPVVTSLLAAKELIDVQVTWGEHPHTHDVWVIIKATSDEIFQGCVYSPDDEMAGDMTNRAVATTLADQLEDWISGTSFAWGERRHADYHLDG